MFQVLPKSKRQEQILNRLLNSSYADQKYYFEMKQKFIEAGVYTKENADHLDHLIKGETEFQISLESRL